MTNNISNFTEEVDKYLPAYFPLYNCIKDFFILLTIFTLGTVSATLFVSMFI